MYNDYYMYIYPDSLFLWPAPPPPPPHHPGQVSVLGSGGTEKVVREEDLQKQEQLRLEDRVSVVYTTLLLELPRGSY